MNKLHILGIAGTFMGGVAALARELGHEVEGSDQAVYPPMSTQLERSGIALRQGYAPEQHLAPTATRSSSATRCRAATPRSSRCSTTAAVTRPARSGWREHVLPGRDTLAVAGTHGKTTTTTILT